MPGLKAQPPPGKANYYGIEVTQSITWQGWQPGREYTKNITLKNVLVKTQKLKYKVPSTRFFSTLYPQAIVLSSGTSYTLPVTFRPLEKIVCNDAIEFTNNEGTFSIPIRAVLPQMCVEAPEKINFNMCAAHDMLQLTFEIKNTSELVTPFLVECLEPFFIEPSEGVLEPFSSFMLTATFKPKAAVVYDAHAIIKYGKESCEITQLTGIGKYPHLLISSPSTAAAAPKGSSNNEAVVSFGSVHIGHTVKKWIEIKNMSPVNAPFSVEHPTMDSIDTVFECHQHRGIVPAMSTHRLPVSYKPNTVGTTSMDYIHVKAIGNISKTIIKCVGSSRGPKVELNQKVINFMQVNAGASATKTLEIINNSDTDASFQFLIDCHESPFKFEHTSGILPAKNKTTLILKFQPFHPINYHKRVTCLVHQQNPLFLDLVGTCHTEMVKPAVLQSNHLKRYQIHVDRGFSFIPPDQLNEMLRDGKLKLDDRGCVYDPTKKGQDLDCMPADLHPMEEFFNDGYHSEVTHTAPHVSLDMAEVAFGQVSDIRLPQQRAVTLTNHTKGKLTVCWMGGSSDFPSGPEHVFTVTPATVDIPPDSSAPFTVTFKPRVPNEFFGRSLEAYVYYKSLRDYRMVNDNTHCPPWCINITATGYTFPASAETYLPRFRLDSGGRHLVFPAVNAHEASYRTMLLDNVGITPIYYAFDSDTTGIYSIKPTRGVVGAGQCQVFVVKIVPKEVKTYKQTLKLRLNDDDKNTQDVHVWGSAEAAEMLLGNDGVLYFKATCVGTASVRQYCVQNLSRIPLRYEWMMSHAERQMLSVQPPTGIIQPNENQFHTWEFAPRQQKKHVMKPMLMVWGQGQSVTSSGGKKQQFVVRAIGEGAIGEIKAETSYLDFNNVVVGSKEEKKITINNHSDCSLHYTLHINQQMDPAYPDDAAYYDPIGLQLDCMKGILPAHSRKVLTATVRPVDRMMYQWTVSYTLVTPQGDAEHANEAQHLCHILATGVHPCMSVVDARCYGSVVGISKKQLWDLFCLEHLNKCLDTDPTVREVRSGSCRRYLPPPTSPNTPSMDFNFSAAPLHSHPCTVQLQVQNGGPVPCEWQFLLPTDLQLQLPYWSETADYDIDELHQIKVLENKLFSIEPKKGKLLPGDSQTITFSYKHIIAGTDRLPVLLKLERGREILINFVGVTVEPDRRYIHFPSSKFMFTPVPIGESNSPKQIYELYNGGAVPVKYTFDLSPLEVIKQDNYDHAIFECLNPVGEISPGQTANVEWRFSPLEAKTYIVDMPIKIDCGDTALVTFEGIGFDKRQLGASMPFMDCATNVTVVPTIQTTQVPGQLVYLSKERISFGNLPLFSRTSRLIALTNRSTEHSVHITWHVTNARDTQTVTISPSGDQLGPGERRQCRITFTAVGFPSFYDIDLICAVMNMTEFVSYQNELKKWEKELQRQKDEFTITETDIDADRRLIDFEPEVRPPSGRLRCLEFGPTIQAPPPEDTDFAKYKTLPPIKQQTVDLLCIKHRVRHKMNLQYWAKPTAPMPFLLHLGVTARTHDVAHFQHNFHDEYKNFYIDRSLTEPNRPDGEVAGGGSELVARQMTCVKAEADVVDGALANIIRGLLDDTEFHEACQKVIDAETPYHVQFVDKPLPAPLTPALTPQQQPQVVILEDEESSPRSRAASGHSKKSRPMSSKTATPGRTAESVIAAQFMDGVELSSTAVSSSQRSKPSSALPSTSSSLTSSRELCTQLHSLAEEDVESSVHKESRFQQSQALKKVPELGTAVKDILQNMLTNIILEGAYGELDLTAPLWRVALPPRINSSNSINTRSATKLP